MLLPRYANAIMLEKEKIVKIRKPKGHDIGKGLTILAHHYLVELHYHADVDAFNAPSECHDLVSKGEAKRLRHTIRRIKAATGLKYSEFKKELNRRTGNDKVFYYATLGCLLPPNPDSYPLLFR